MRSRLLILLLLVTTLGLAVAGCRVQFGEGPAGEFSPATPGVLTVATEKVPTIGFWLGTRARPTGGFEYELAVALANRFGLDRIEIRTVPFEKLTAGDLDGADLALRELTPTAQREKKLDFSTPYIAAPPAALVRAGERIPDLKTARELSWVVPEGTTLVATLEDLVRPERMTTAPDRPAVVHRVINGEADAALFDLPVALALARASKGRLEVAAQFGGNETFAAALPKGSGNLEAVNSAIRALAADGTISELSERWLGVSLWGDSFQVPSVPLIRS